MYTSDITKKTGKATKTALTYLLVSLFCVLLGAVYEKYSHEVYSYYMIYAFVFPLAGGVLPFTLFGLKEERHYPNAISRNLYHSGIATLTVGSFLQGALEIYGTTNMLVKGYWLAGGIFVAAGVLIWVVGCALAGKEKIQPIGKEEN